MQKLMDRDFLAALVLLFIGAVALTNAGADPMNWAFPRMAAYFALFVAAILFLRVVFAKVVKRAPDVIRIDTKDRIVAIDVLVFLSVALCYLLVMYGLGFWLSSFLMLSAASIYLTMDKTPKNIGIAVFVSLAICVVSFLVFEHVFYVPVPEAHWWPLGSS